jgi:hypothetical protein
VPTLCVTGVLVIVRLEFVGIFRGVWPWLKNRETISTPELLIAAFVLAVLVSAGSLFTITVLRAAVIRRQLPLYADPTFISLNLAGAAPWPVPITCCGCPLPQCGVPQSTHSSREQIASREFQNSVVMPE